MPSQRLDDTTSGPSALWLAAGFLLAGLGTVLLGPILPGIITRWHLKDSEAGILIFAKFTGSFIGGVTVPRRLRYGILSGMVLGCLGFGAFSLCDNLIAGSLALFVGGIGLGHIIAATNILAGRRYTAHTGSALASLNFFWSLGAVATGLIVATLEPRFGLRNLLLTFAVSFLAVGLGGRLTWNFQTTQQTTNNKPSITKIPAQALTLFALFLFLYGGLETCLTGWLSTYAIRYSETRLLAGQSAIVLLWTALTLGRALSSIALRFFDESIIQRISLLLSFCCIAALTTAHRAATLSLWSILLGLCLAPFFPATFALLMHRKPSAREAGFILAVSGLGAATFPYLMGRVSTHTGSLRIAMTVPAALALCLLAASFIRIDRRSSRRQLAT